MSKLLITQNNQLSTVSFDGQPILRDVLNLAGYPIPQPCAGHGICGKCAVEIEGFISPPNEVEQHTGHRLACQVKLLGDSSVILPALPSAHKIETRISDVDIPLQPITSYYGAAIDIGTTTIAVKIYDLSTGTCVGEAACLNSQIAVAADIMGRIDAACNGLGKYLQKVVLKDVEHLLYTASNDKNISARIDSLVIAGNTTMLYLLNGFDPKFMSRAPFSAEYLFDTETKLLGKHCYFPPCMSAFVGADITCAVLASGICHDSAAALLCDIGTNGEIALWKNGILYVTSTAAGPAFEGAGISCGCGSIPGAIDKVWVADNVIHYHTIGNAEPVGICGSGLIDSIAVGLKYGSIDETGALAHDSFSLCDSVQLLPKDIRAVQLAKAAIAAGIATLTEVAGITTDEIRTFYIAGGFGSHLNIENAAYIGLIPAKLKSRVKILGNASLTGAVYALLNTNTWQQLRKIANASRHIDLGGNPKFNENYIEHMLFE